MDTKFRLVDYDVNRRFAIGKRAGTVTTDGALQSE